MQFSIHPNVYSTHPKTKGLLNMLEQTWVRAPKPGEGTFFIVSGFSNYNGGVRFYETFRQHIEKGGACIAVLGGSTSQRLSSQQVVDELLQIGCKVYLINRKRILHAKCYGHSSDKGDSLIISSGNFTGPGMSQNIEASMFVDPETVAKMGFSWKALIENVLRQKWDIYEPSIADKAHPSWKLLYDEVAGAIKLEDEQEVTMLITLGHNDTARIQANPTDIAGKGTQYFWLSKDSFDFFPALTIRNKRGHKATYSTIINMEYIDLGIVDQECRVTYEEENNVDFRLGTGKLKFTKLAAKGDLAAISRTSEFDYQLRIIKKETDLYSRCISYAVNFIGHKGKKYGYIANTDFLKLL